MKATLWTDMCLQKLSAAERRRDGEIMGTTNCEDQAEGRKEGRKAVKVKV